MGNGKRPGIGALGGGRLSSRMINLYSVNGQNMWARSIDIQRRTYGEAAKKQKKLWEETVHVPRLHRNLPRHLLNEQGVDWNSTKAINEHLYRNHPSPDAFRRDNRFAASRGEWDPLRDQVQQCLFGFRDLET